jgi:hypothetical protein
VGKDEFRPWNIAYNVYGCDISLWWLIMVYNDLLSIDSVTFNTELKLPNLDSVFQLFKDAYIKQNLLNLELSLIGT